MAQVIFFEKPGCINNTKQKRWLIAAGHEVIAENILDTEWQNDELCRYFGSKPISECFNTTAPGIKSGEIDPEAFSKQQALELMCKEPILIKRPLLRVGDERLQGFHKEIIDRWIGLKPSKGNEAIVEDLRQEDLTVCPRLTREKNCEELSSAIPERPLSLIMEITNAAGLEVTYEYDDLVFASHNLLIYKFTQTGSKVDIFFNQDCEKDAEQKYLEILVSAAGQRGITLSRRGHYRLCEADKENISIEFI